MGKIILTGNYENCKIGNVISISGDKGKSAGFSGQTMTILAPKKSFWQIWHNNIGKISEEENIEYYIREFYNQVLKNLDSQEVLEKLPNKAILLCYENNMDFCHRHLVAFWFELFLGIKTYEVRQNGNRETIVSLGRPEYLKEKLEKIIKESYPMHDFESIHDAYLYNKANGYFNEDGKKLKLTNNNCYDKNLVSNIAIK